MVRERASRSQEARRVYDLRVRPIEHAHRGEYALITPDGQTIFAPTLEDVMRRAHERAHRDNLIFKVGDVALGRL